MSKDIINNILPLLFLRSDTWVLSSSATFNLLRKHSWKRLMTSVFYKTNVQVILLYPHLFQQNQDIIFSNNTSSQSNVQNKGVYRLRRQTLDGGWCDTAHALASAGDSCTWSGSSTLTIRFTWLTIYRLFWWALSRCVLGARNKRWVQPYQHIFS